MNSCLAHAGLHSGREMVLQQAANGRSFPPGIWPVSSYHNAGYRRISEIANKIK